MNNIKNPSKKKMLLRSFIDKITDNLRKTKMGQEYVWRNREKEWNKENLAPDSHFHRNMILEKVKNCAPFQSLLEIGSGWGPNLYLIAKEFPKAKIKGIDINKNAIEEGKKRFKKEKILNIELSIGNINKLKKIKDKSFDIKISDTTLIYKGKNEIEKVVAEIKRITRKTIILVEYHSKKETALGEWIGSNWLRNYEKLFHGFAQEVEITKIPPEKWNGEWGEFGYIIKVNLKE